MYIQQDKNNVDITISTRNTWYMYKQQNKLHCILLVIPRGAHGLINLATNTYDISHELCSFDTLCVFGVMRISVCLFIRYNYSYYSGLLHWSGGIGQFATEVTLKYRLNHPVAKEKHHNMMTSSNGSIFRVIGFCEENPSVTGGFPFQRPGTRSFDVFFHLRPKKRLTKQLRRWRFETPSRILWRHCNEHSKEWTVCIFLKGYTTHHIDNGDRETKD